MKILWICPYLPVPTFGSGTRVYNLIKVLAPHCTIDLLASTEGHYPTELSTLKTLCRHVMLVDPAVGTRRGRRMRQLRALFSLRSSQYWTTYSVAMQQQIDAAVKAGEYDLVILVHSFMGYYQMPAGLPIVLDQHNVESEVLRQAGQIGYSRLQRIYNLIDY